jgi:hypothetical protein
LSDTDGIDIDIISADDNDINALMKAVSSALKNDPDILMIQYGGLQTTPIKQVQVAFSRIRQQAVVTKTPVLFIDNPVSDSDSKFDEIDQWLKKSGFNFITVGNLSADYVNRKGRDLNKAGNDIIYRKVVRYLKRIDAKLEPDNTQDDTAGIKKPEGDELASTNAITLPAKYRKRTGEATDWEAVMDFFIDKGIPKAGAAAIAGNMKVESNFKPDVYGDKGSSIGLAQWHATRMQGLFNFAKDKDLNPYSVDTQLEWCWHELNTTFKPVLKNLMAATDARDAAEDFARMYERPAVISPKRMEYAAQYDEQYSSIENTIKRGAETVAGAVGRGVASLASIATGILSNRGSAPKVNSKNGQLSSSELKSIGNGHFLAPAAADDFLKMKAAAAKDKIDIKLTDSYRPLSVQTNKFDWDLFNRTGKKKKINTNGRIAMAYPGTSNHGLGRAIDVDGSAAQKWIRDNGEAYGWSWAEGRSVGEPWHFTYVK